MSRVVASRYAKGLLEVAQEHNVLDEVEQQLSQISSIIANEPELKQVLNHPQVEITEKKKLIATLFEKEIKEELLNFLYLLVDRRREMFIDEISDEFTRLANEARGIADATIISAKPLSEQQQQDIAKRFGKELNKTLRVENQVDPSIIGGLVIRIGDRLYDGSVAGKLQQFQQELKHS
ncbi:MAG: F0F1 ATP synthase subunit delta [Bacillaceae bacterium]|nr:F0F1 ATP synthase subunit delta [Bacillaceae bacterium]